MSILYEKLSVNFDKKELIKIIGECAEYRLSKGIFKNFDILFNKFLPYNIYEIINYNYSDFISDFQEYLSIYSHNTYRIIFEIIKNGYSITSYSKKIQISYCTAAIFFKKYLLEEIEPMTVWKICWIINKDKLPFEAQIEFLKKKGYAKIIGNRDTIEELKELYSIPYPVLYYTNDLWHIAFWWI